MNFLNFCAKTPVIIATFLAVIFIGWGFGMFTHHIGGSLLDEQYSAVDVLSRLAEMSPSQKSAHIWITLTLDSLFPLANFMFLAGVVWRLGGAKRGWLALPALIYVLSDYTENLIEIMILRGNESLAGIKTIFTIAKSGALTLAFLIAIVLLIMAVVRKVKA